MDDEQQYQVASNLETTPELLPYLDELLADLWALGCDPGAVLDLLRPLDLAPDATRVLDLACGKGALAIPLAYDLGFRVDGVDLYPPFVEEARRRAAELGVNDRCRFEVGDLRRRLRPQRPYDIVIYASVGVLGRHDDTVGELRRAARPGGYLVIDDGFLGQAARLDRAGYEHYVSHGETVGRLESHGDRILGEVRIDPRQLHRTNRRDTGKIRRRVEELCARHPEKAKLFRAYLERQEEECATLEAHFVCAVWLLATAS